MPSIKKIIQRLSTKQKAIFIILGLISLSLVPLGVVVSNYNVTKRQLTSQINNANFTVTKFDITSTTEDTVFAEGRANISSQVSQTSLDEISIRSIYIEIYNHTEIITSTQLPIDKQDFNSGVNFSLEIPLDQNKVAASETTVNVLTNILLNVDFDLSIKGTIRYKIGIIRDKISFTNKLYFRLQQPELRFDLNYMDLESNPIDAKFNIFNPFNVDIGIEGQVDVILNKTKLGNINVEPLTIHHGSNNITETLNPTLSPHTIIQIYFDNFGKEIVFPTSLILSVGEIGFNTTPTLTVGITTALSAQINSANNITFTNQTAEAELDLTLDAELPMDLNLTYLHLFLFKNQAQVAELRWNGSYIVLNAGEKVKMQNVSVILNIDRLPLAEFLRGGEYNIQNSTINISLNNTVKPIHLNDVEFSLSN